MSLETMRALSPYELARLAECGEPDTFTSAGAAFLCGVRDELADYLQDGQYSEDIAAEIADGAPDIYTHRKWQQFIDLEAYFEDTDLFSGGNENMDQLASMALYMIAERLVNVLANEYHEEN